MTRIVGGTRKGHKYNWKNMGHSKGSQVRPEEYGGTQMPHKHDLRKYGHTEGAWVWSEYNGLRGGERDMIWIWRTERPQVQEEECNEAHRDK